MSVKRREYLYADSVNYEECFLYFISDIFEKQKSNENTGYKGDRYKERI